MNKHSILRLITLFFLFIFALINALFWIAHQHFLEQYQEEQMRRFMLSERLIHHRNGNFDTELKQLNIRVSSLSPSLLIREGETVQKLPFGKILEYHHRHYFVKTPPPRFLDDHVNHQPKFAFPPPPPEFFLPLVLEDQSHHSFVPFWITAILIDLLILLFFAYLVRKLIPLHHLKNAIIHFNEGDTHLKMSINGKDEISQITQEFNLVLQKIASMKESRSLFLRNILHELKTPIMKGSLTTDCLDISEEQERLKRIFNRMNYLLGEFSTMERFNSGEWELNLQEYRFVDLLDHACDILLCSKNSLEIMGEEAGLIINVDFELFAIALKNLIDNALKYSETKPSIIIKNHTIEVCSSGDPLSEENRTFDKAFNRTYESSMTGLGLGLYITHSILQKHGYTLHYHHDSRINYFRIVL